MQLEERTRILDIQQKARNQREKDATELAMVKQVLQAKHEPMEAKLHQEAALIEEQVCPHALFASNMTAFRKHPKIFFFVAVAKPSKAVSKISIVLVKPSEVVAKTFSRSQNFLLRTEAAAKFIFNKKHVINVH